MNGLAISWQQLLPITIWFVFSIQLGAKEWHVPQEISTIQEAIDLATSQDVVIVASGRFQERIQLKAGIVVRGSPITDSRGESLEPTILDGGGINGNLPGVEMAEGSTLDSFTITGVGRYDPDEWQKHFDSHGEELGDDEGAMQAEGSIPAISVRGVSCTITNCVIHHNGDVGIGIVGLPDRRTAPDVNNNTIYRNMGGGIGIAAGGEPTIKRNICRENLRAGIGCRQSNPIIIENTCCQNVRAGIGCREGGKPVIRSNTCFQNRRAGIGIRMRETMPLVEGNELYENAMAGIGCRDEASPMLIRNICRQNALAGIGCHAASPFMDGNRCIENSQAGVGLEGNSHAIIQNTYCLENQLVAIGVTGGSTAIITSNQLTRTAGAPPIIAVLGNSRAIIVDNQISGGGVAAILVKGEAIIERNRLTGINIKQGNAIWGQPQSSITVSGNHFDGYKSAISATQANVIIRDNQIVNFGRRAILVHESTTPVYIVNNKGSSDDVSAQIVNDDVVGSGTVERNELLP
ncbi:MAG: right-handed parallel beta-helix repeat-containing protein [Planctomycetales bacterium]|nr:right-handed parallel beta-helix repeat-containing protein [Planctomycetales bacterium]